MTGFQISCDVTRSCLHLLKLRFNVSTDKLSLFSSWMWKHPCSVTHHSVWWSSNINTNSKKDIFWTGEGLQEGFWMKYFYIVVYTCLYVSKAMLPATFTGKDTNTVNYYRVSEHLPGAAPSTGNKRCHFHYNWNLLGLMGPNPPCSLCQPA